MNKKLQTTIEKMPQTGFHFNDEAHIYLLDGKPLTGVTTILSVIAKPALIQWAADMAVTYLGWFNEKYSDEETKKLQLTLAEAQHKLITSMNFETYFKFLGEARVQHAKRKKDAGTVGTDIHAEIEKIIKEAIEKTGGYIFGQFAFSNNMVSTFVGWALENDVKFLASEKRIYSREYWYAGTVDFIAEIDGKIWIGDIKTSGSIYPEYFFQTAGYQLAIQEMGDYPQIEGHIIINCKKDGGFQVEKSYGYEQNKQAFLAALTIYRAQENLKITL